MTTQVVDGWTQNSKRRAWGIRVEWRAGTSYSDKAGKPHGSQIIGRVPGSSELELSPHEFAAGVVKMVPPDVLWLHFPSALLSRVNGEVLLDL